MAFSVSDLIDRILDANGVASAETLDRLVNALADVTGVSVSVCGILTRDRDGRARLLLCERTKNDDSQATPVAP